MTVYFKGFLIANPCEKLFLKLKNFFKEMIEFQNFIQDWNYVLGIMPKYIYKDKNIYFRDANNRPRPAITDHCFFEFNHLSVHFPVNISCLLINVYAKSFF